MDTAPSHPTCLRIAAAGDIHCSEHHPDEVRRAFASLPQSADLVLLAGDLTTHGEPQQAQVLAEACGSVEIPVLAVLGNHDWHADRAAELVEILSAAGVQVLDRSWTICACAGVDVGVVGVKGFVGGFSGSHLPDFGEPLLRAVYQETSREVDALEQGLREIEVCPVRVALMHYAPSQATVVGEPPGIWAFLGSDRLGGPIVQHEPDIVLHGHAHSGTFEAAIGAVPVYNVSVPVMGRAFWLFELDVSTRAGTALH
jgi:uncharacterized protein